MADEEDEFSRLTNELAQETQIISVVVRNGEPTVVSDGLEPDEIIAMLFKSLFMICFDQYMRDVVDDEVDEDEASS